MRAYVGQGNMSKGCKLVAKLRAKGLGLCLCPGELPPRYTDHGWFLDNGAFRAWRAGTPFNKDAFREALLRCVFDGLDPDFVVAPDIVGGGMASLAFSLSWLPELEGFRVFLAVQDGMAPSDVRPHLARFDGIFVGGTLEWKLATGTQWVDLAHEHGKPCHVGRVGTPKRVDWARAIGVDSIDSSLPLWSREQFEGFMGALRSQQRRMWEET